MKQDQLNNELNQINKSIQIVIKTLKRARMYDELEPVNHISRLGLDRMSQHLKTLIKLRDQKLRELVDSLREVA